MIDPIFLSDSCQQAFYSNTGTTNNCKLARAFVKDKRITILSRNRTDNSNAEFYNPDKYKVVKMVKSLSSGPARFAKVRVSLIL